ncbi:MAG: radical SAM protein [Anaerolineae bacterium]
MILQIDELDDRAFDIKVGYKCNNKCLHCVVDPIRTDMKIRGQPIDLTTDEVLAAIDNAKAHQGSAVILTGGEVTIRADFSRIVSHAATQGMKVTLQSNGRALANMENCRALEKIPNLTLVIAIHANTSVIHDAITGRKGSYEQTICAVQNLRKIGKQIIAKIVISKLNVEYLFSTVQFVEELGVNQASLAFPHAPGFTVPRFHEVVPRYSAIKASIQSIAEHSDRVGFWVDFEAIPLCICPSSPQFWGRSTDVISQRRTPTDRVFEERQFDASVLDWGTIRKDMKWKSNRCCQCLFDSLCEGPWIEYVDHYGSDEFKPIEQLEHRD